MKNFFLTSLLILSCLGGFKTPGTTIDSLVLISSEISVADNTTETSEFPDNLSHLEIYFITKPILFNKSKTIYYEN
ncbi:hypothetical protein A9Q86_01925 [Flavobacteriales bacterium 33_180_T64]|nr:hypothetical protein A9Q86_01925 [Flavobacteriales bacterium 33_180_T64]